MDESNLMFLGAAVGGLLCLGMTAVGVGAWLLLRAPAIQQPQSRPTATRPQPQVSRAEPTEPAAEPAPAAQPAAAPPGPATNPPPEPLRSRAQGATIIAFDDDDDA